MVELDAVVGRSLEVAEELGLLARLKVGKGSAESLASELGLALRGVRPLLYVLTSAGLLIQEGDAFSIGADGVRFLEKEWPATQCPRLPDWDLLEQAVRAGRCTRPPIEADGGEFFSQVVETLFPLHFPAAQHLHSVLPEDAETILDLGAGSAVWSLGLMTQRPGAQAVAVDRAQVLDEVTTQFLTRHGVEDRYHLRPGNYLEMELEPEAYQVVFLGHVLHSEGWERSRSLLHRCYRALAPEGTLVIAEMLGTEPRGLDHCSNLFDLNMLMFTEFGCVFTRRELEQLTEEAGFVDPRWVDGPGQYPPLLVRKQGPQGADNNSRR